MGIADVQRALYRLSPDNGAGLSGQFSFVDIFAGIGGMRLGFEAAGGTILDVGHDLSFLRDQANVTHLAPLPCRSNRPIEPAGI
jgi:hypothetical protein